MDLQGQPVGASRSTKVTTDPKAYQQPINETSGPVPNDSLAAESATHGGAYSQNRGAEPLGVSGNQSTLNNTNTSGATTLPSAPVGTARENINRQDKYPEGLGGQGDFPGAHLPQSGYTGGPTTAKKDLGIGTGQGQYKAKAGGGGGADASGSGYHSQYNGGQAPSYVSDVTEQLGNTKPNGKNLQEGGFDSDPSHNASFNNQVGNRQDPGRAGLNDLQYRVAQSGPDAGGGPRQKGIDNQHWYQALEPDQRA